MTWRVELKKNESQVAGLLLCYYRSMHLICWVSMHDFHRPFYGCQLGFGIKLPPNSLPPSWTQYHPHDHTGTNTAEVLEETIQLNQRSWWESLLTVVWTLSWHVTCLTGSGWVVFGRNLNLVVGKGLNDVRVQRTLRVCRSAVAAFSEAAKSNET